MVITLLVILFSGFVQAADISLDELFADQTKDYKAKNWDKVFARGHFYRHQYLRNESEIKAAFSPNLYKLEIYGLAEKCQWDIVTTLVDDFKRLEKIKYNNLKKSKEIEKKLESFKTYKIVTKESAKSESNVLANSITVAAIDWKQVKEINDLSIEVEDLCQK